jgi:ankyrin repeat protein
LTNKDTNEILFNGIQSGNFESINSAINLEADINSTDDKGWSALHWACNEDGGHLKVVLL